MKISKINQELINLFNEINDFVEMDHAGEFDVYDGYLTANIKVYKWLDSEDVDAIIKKHGLKKKKKIHKEFNSERLQGIKDHVNEWELSEFKESFSWRNKTGNEKWDNALYTITADARDVWQWGNGGHLSFCKKEEIEFQYNHNDASNDADIFKEYYCQEWTNKELNEFLNEHLDIDGKSKRKRIAEYRHELKEMKEIVNACKYIEQEIERIAKSMDYVWRLEDEILEFCRENTSQANCTVSIQDGKIRTSLGVTVNAEPVKHFLQSIQLPNDKKKVKINTKVEGWNIEKARKAKGDWIIKAGCHLFSLNQVKEVFSL